MISSNSRYRDSTVLTINKKNPSAVAATTISTTDTLVIVPGTPVNFTFSFVYYIVDGSDRLDTIANAFYGDPSKWWQIADANPEIINWLIIPTGTILRIPNA